MSELTSAAVPAVGPGDHVRGNGPEVVLYLDLACPACAATWLEIRELPLRLCLRHFPLPKKRPRAPALHAAAEAAAAQRKDAFWEMVDSIYGDHGHLDDPHLWDRARTLGLDLDRFERDRRSDGVATRVRRDFESGIRAGVVGTPTGFSAGTRLEGSLTEALTRLAGDSGRPL
ncbi:MAG TPA: DsbA family protein [Solirubrobacterales bacterium]|nr:DsbA family protein [Solirubrobacterales bacterium]